MRARSSTRVPAALLRREAVLAEFGAGVERDLAGGPDAEGIGETADGFGGGGELQQGVVVEQACVGIGEGGEQEKRCASASASVGVPMGSILPRRGRLA